MKELNTTTDHPRNHRPKVRRSNVEKNVKFKDCINKFHTPKSPDFYQALVLEWFLKWN